MDWLTDIRNQIGWTQAELAGYLGVQRSLLSMAELGERDLPTKAHMKAAQLQQKLNELSGAAPDKKTAALLKKLDAEAKEERKRLKKEAAFEKQRAKRQLAVAEKNYNEALHTLKLLPQLRKHMEENGEPSAIVGLIDIQEHKALKKLKAYGPKKLERLRAKAKGRK
ncbi:MAG: helix-turn-helix domain-containing protein [Cyclobacteriaceae bacterium]